jgi:hypothetical protein
MCEIKNGPGKFEAEPCYAEELYDLWNSGQLDESDDCEFGILEFGVEADHDAEFWRKHNIAPEVKAIQISEDSYGFVWTNEITEELP